MAQLTILVAHKGRGRGRKARDAPVLVLRYTVYFVAPGHTLGPFEKLFRGTAKLGKKNLGDPKTQNCEPRNGG